MLVPFPGTKEFDNLFESIPLNKIEWDNFVAVGEKCVLNNVEISAKEIEALIAKANIRYYANLERFLNILFHIRTSYEFSNYMKGGWGFLQQILKWKRPQ